MANQPARFRQCELSRAVKVADKENRIVKIVDGVIYLVKDNGESGDNRSQGLVGEQEGYL